MSNAGRASSTPPLGISSAPSKRGEIPWSCPRLAASRSSVAVAPRPIGAAQSSSARARFVLGLAAHYRQAALFFSGRTHPSGPYRFAQRVAFQTKPLGDVRFA